MNHASPPDETAPPVAEIVPAERRQRHVGTARAIHAIKSRHSAGRSAMQILADVLSRVTGSPPFLAVHAVWFIAWILWNTAVFGTRPFDPFPFGLLTMVVSLEAIFLSIFVLMTQRRESAIAELREEITLQVILRTEEEVTKTLQLVAGLYTRLGHKMGHDPELTAMLTPLDAEAIERQLTAQIVQAERIRHAKR